MADEMKTAPEVKVRYSDEELQEFKAIILEMLENAKKELVDAFNNRPYTFFGMPAIKKSLELLEKPEIVKPLPSRVPL